MTHTVEMFVVNLGGHAPKASTELHDVMFVAGASIEDTYEQCLDKWFGSPEGLHLDSWIQLDVVDGHRVTLTEKPNSAAAKLFFVNLGAYQVGEFSEFHATKFLVAERKQEAKVRAKDQLAQKAVLTVHTDTLFDVDDCIAIDKVGRFFVGLEPTSMLHPLIPQNGYHVIPKKFIERFLSARRAKGLARSVC